MRFSLNKGDVFVVPLGDGRAGVGQIVGRYRKVYYYMAIFDQVVPDTQADLSGLLPLTAESIVLLALTLDGKLYARHWSVVGSAPVTDLVPFPAYKEAVGFPPKYEVVDYSGERRRRATPREEEDLPYRAVVAPALLEMALKARLGLGPAHESFGQLQIGGITSAEAFA